MRKIKFRAWDKEDNRMFNHHELLEEEVNYRQIFTNDDNKTFELMQYTGLKDKNGVETYEGDIVTILGNTAEVSMINSCWCYQRVDNYNIQPLGDFSNISYEVIGNIYEHSHLLDNS